MPNRLILPPFTAAFVLSAEAKGRCWKMAGASIRSPCSLHIGRPLSSQTASIAAPIRFHHDPVPGVAHCPELPRATVRQHLASRCRRSVDSCKCQIGTPRSSSGHCRTRSSLASSSPSMTSGMSAQVKPGCRCQSSTHLVYPLDVNLPTLFPYRERAVIENKRFAHIGDDPKIVLARERHQRVPAGQELCRILSLTADRRAVVVDHPLSLTVSISTPWCVAMMV